MVESFFFSFFWILLLVSEICALIIPHDYVPIASLVNSFGLMSR